MQRESLNSQQTQEAWQEKKEAHPASLEIKGFSSCFPVTSEEVKTLDWNQIWNMHTLSIAWEINANFPMASSSSNTAAWRSGVKKKKSMFSMQTCGKIIVAAYDYLNIDEDWSWVCWQHFSIIRTFSFRTEIAALLTIRVNQLCHKSQYSTYEILFPLALNTRHGSLYSIQCIKASIWYRSELLEGNTMQETMVSFEEWSDMHHSPGTTCTVATALILRAAFWAHNFISRSDYLKCIQIITITCVQFMPDSVHC